MNVLITGGAGFIGSNIARYFSNLGHVVHGCGRGQLTASKKSEIGFSSWLSGPISEELLSQIDFVPDVVIHCAGGGSVDRSIEDPRTDYINTVKSTQIVLEFFRLRAPFAKFIYPSSPAIVGSFANQPIPVLMPAAPISTYGHDKLMAENLCESYRHNYGLDITIIRLFSVYGTGLQKQLLWDACNKLTIENPAQFWGDGNETRDYIHITDVSKLFYLICINKKKNLPHKMNCGSGVAYKVKDVIELLKKSFENSPEFIFNNLIRKGHPRHYWADIREANQYGWGPELMLEAGILEYANWYKSLK